jgi:hypothetical protein
MQRLLQTFVPLERSGRLLARLFSFVGPRPGPAKPHAAFPTGQATATQKLFRQYLNEGLGGGGRR